MFHFIFFSFMGVNYVWMVCHLLAMSNSCCNPFIYGIYNVSSYRIDVWLFSYVAVFRACDTHVLTMSDFHDFGLT